MSEKLSEARLMLAAPFPFEDTGHRIVATVEDRGLSQIAFYIDARAVMDRLDALGLVWSDEYVVLPDGKHIECRLTVDGVTRCDVGEENEGGHADAVKAAYSDALKRAAVKFGIGRYLYGGARAWVESEKRGRNWAVKKDQEHKIRQAYAKLCGNIAAATPETPEREDDAPRTASTTGRASQAAVTAFWTGVKELHIVSGDALRALGWESIAGKSEAELVEGLKRLRIGVAA